MGFPVVDSGRLVGILCQSDLIAQQKNLPLPSYSPSWTVLFLCDLPSTSKKTFQKIAATTVADSMTPDPVTVHLQTSIEDIAASDGGQEFSHPSRGGRKKTCGDYREEDVLGPDVERRTQMR